SPLTGTMVLRPGKEETWSAAGGAAAGMMKGTAMMRIGSRWLLGLAGTAAAFYLTLPAQADVVIFKDGFMLYGKVSRDGETITNRGAQPFQFPSDPFYIPDGARRVYFSHSQVASANNKDVYEGAEIVQLNRRVSKLYAQPLPAPLLDIRKVSEW